MRDTDSTSGHIGRTWQGLKQRRWPLWLAAVLAIAVAWVVFRRNPPPGDQPGATAEDGVSAAASPGDSVVALDTTSERLAGIELITVGAARVGILSANGTITYDGNHVSVVASRAEGRVVSIRTDLGQRVRQGDVLVIVESPEVGGTRGTYGRAQAAIEVARRNYEREKRLYEQSITSQKELLEAEGEYRSAQAELNAALAKLKALGASPVGEGGTFGLASPVSGTVVERHATPGQIAGPSTDLLTVADLRHVWITVDVYEADFSRVKNGVPAKVIPTALRDTFPGKVTFAGGVVDSLTRTVKVRVEVENETRLLRPGMFAQVYIETAIP
ncbi:MAG: efflux RND transporter periplasmic adaptor subunit, partial [Gemmatimonadales bacterium]